MPSRLIRFRRLKIFLLLILICHSYLFSCNIFIRILLSSTIVKTIYWSLKCNSEWPSCHLLVAVCLISSNLNVHAKPENSGHYTIKVTLNSTS
jgi:hypothetical protein